MPIEVSGGLAEVVPKFKKKMRDKKAHAFTKQMIKRGIVADPNAPMAGTHSQPATPAYRSGWDRIWGEKGETTRIQGGLNQGENAQEGSTSSVDSHRTAESL